MPGQHFIHLLEQLHKTSSQRQLPWHPVRKARYSSRCDFHIALGEGIIRIECNDDYSETPESYFSACLSTRDGLQIDELAADNDESEYYPLLHEIYQQARIGAFDLSRMIDGMQRDLESGNVRDLPKDDSDDGEIPF